jgi:hypothetical protein
VLTAMAMATVSKYYTKLKSLDPHPIDLFVVLILTLSLSYYIPILLHPKCPNLADPEDIPGHARALQATAATIAISIPLLLESLMDINLPREITISRWMHITGLIVPNFVVLIRQESIFYISSGLARASILIGSLMLHMFNDPKLFTRSRKLRYLAIFLSLQICFQYRLYRICYPNYDFFKQINVVLIAAIGLTSLVIFILTVIRFVFVDGAYEGGEKYCVFYSIGGVVAVVVYATYAVIITSEGKERQYTAGDNLVATLMVESALSTFASLIPTRIARHDRDQAEVRSLYPSLSFSHCLISLCLSVSLSLSLSHSPLLLFSSFSSHLRSSSSKPRRSSCGSSLTSTACL